MTKITSLADEIRNRIAQPQEAPSRENIPKKKEKEKAPEAAILQLIREYDNSDHKTLVHARFDEKTVQVMNHFKMATGVDVTRLVAFSVRHLFEQHPELKMIIKQFIENVNL
jgi:hypothetical protein